MHVIELCAGGGGQALGIEQASFIHVAALDIDKHCCDTLRLNRPHWNVIESNLVDFNGSSYAGVDLLAAGLPCPPFSVAGKQLGERDERNLFPDALRIIDEVRPKAVIFENVRGLLHPVFAAYRAHIDTYLSKLGYTAAWRLLYAADFGVPQLRPRVVCVALRHAFADTFRWPQKLPYEPPTVGTILYDLMSVRGWRGARAWSQQANTIAPTIVGGSLKHGGPDLGPSRARQAWAALGVDGLGIWDEPPAPDFVGAPRLTVRMVARLQGFPDDWQFAGRKTAAYRQVGNAFPPPVACAVARQVYACLTSQRYVQIPAEVEA
ncbi:MAG: DNA cytosine methyltransferase [Chloroflexaceae bacterium]|nr:DNA cytosine methyltransferase [Chloroflexaceae bacterium]